MNTKKIGNGVRGLALDAVGTVIEPFPTVAEVYAEAAARQGVDLDRAVVKARFHRSFRDDEVDEARGPLATDEPTEHRRWRRIVAGVLPEVPDPTRVFEELWDHFSRPISWRCFPDVGPALEHLQRCDVPIRLASNFDGRLRAIVRGLPELARLADNLVISSEVGYRKPHPAFFQAVCASFGFPPECLVSVGDDLENDVLGAERAGLRGLLVVRRGPIPERVASIPNLEELIANWPLIDL